MNDENTTVQRAMIAAADPVAELPALRHDQVVTLARAASDTDASASAAPARRPSRRAAFAAGLAVAAVVIVAGAAIVIPLTTAPPAQPLVLGQVPGGISAKCMAPDAAMLAEFADTMFRADVEGIASGTVTLHVTEQFAGEPASVIEVAQGDGMISDGGPLVFEDEGSYLLASSDGVILSCGLSGPASPELEVLYEQAAALKG